MKFDPIAYAAAVKANPDAYVRISELALEASRNIAQLRAIWECQTLDDLKLEFGAAWLASADRPEFQVRLKDSYERRKKELPY